MFILPAELMLPVYVPSENLLIHCTVSSCLPADLLQAHNCSLPFPWPFASLFHNPFLQMLSAFLHHRKQILYWRYLLTLRESKESFHSVTAGSIPPCQ